MPIKANLVILLCILSPAIFGLYPEVSASNNDIVYKQVTTDIKENIQRIHLKKETIPVHFYNYTIEGSETIFTISARFNLTYDTIASLNNIENQLFFKGLNHLIIPTCPGLYSKTEIPREKSTLLTIKGETFYFYPGKKFSGARRLDFLTTPFKGPLLTMKITSGFGNRENPFTGRNEYHSGLDLKAHIGTKIFSPYRGVINNRGYSDFYGNYLIIEHPHGYSTHYYHLKSIALNIGEHVEKGDLVALSGNSGRSTGPHLHFEIQLKGEPINPSMLLGDV